MTYLNSFLLICIIALCTTGCSGGGGGGASGGGSPASPIDSVTVSPTAYQDKKFIIDLSSFSSSATSVTFQNGPSWLTFNSVTKKIEGVPNENVNIANLSFTVTKSDGSSSTFGPYSISVNGDPLRKYQWHIQNTGQTNFATNPGVAGNDINQTQTIQSGITGSGVKVAVSDSGVEIAHEDLSANIIAGASKNYNLSSPYIGDPTPTSTTDGSVGHGTAVAGIIGAVGWNNIGIRGIAPNVKIAGLRFLGSAQNTAMSIDQANGSFDIFNYSYGGPSLYPKIEDTAYLAQLRYGTTSQRGGKGSFYVKSAGNEFTSDFAYDSTGGALNCFNTGSGINANCHYFGNSNFGSAENSTTDVIVVGAINSQGTRSSYSTPGSNIWVSAPGGEFGDTDPALMTTDIQGCDKGLSSTLETPVNSFENSSSLNPSCKYTSKMNGTSSAAPVTSGVIALILEANPNLTWRDVKYILASTATKTDSTATSTSHPSSGLNLAGYTYQQGWIQNAAGFWFHNWYGFGRVNVDAAIQLAKTYTGSLGAFRETKYGDSTWIYDSGVLSLAIPDNSATGVTSSVSVLHNYIIEGVQIQFSTNHQWITDLGVELTSPSGTKSILMNINSGAFLNNSLSYTGQFLSNAFYGEPSGGTWTLKVIDGSTGDTGNLTNWKINIVGHPNPAPSDITPPNPISNLIHAVAYNSSTTSPSITWTGSASPDVMRYEISIGTSAGNTSKLNWTPIGLLTAYQATGLSLTVGQTYYVNVRAIDTSENISTVVSSSGWLYTTASAPTFSISVPSVLKMNSSGSSAYTVTYSGASTITLSNGDITLTQVGVSCSKAVTGSGATTRTVTISNCTGDGTVKISIAANTASNSVGVQAGSAGPSSTITIDNTAPTITGLSNDAVARNSKTWTWGCNDSPCTYRYVVDTSATTSPSGVYSSTASATQSTGTGTYYIHVQAQDTAGNISATVHYSAVVDNTAPNLTGLSSDSTWRTSKTWSWGCDKTCTYIYVVDTSSSTTPAGTYATATTATQSTGTGTYYIHVRAKDSAGNLSAVVHVSALVDSTIPSVPGAISLSSVYTQSLTNSPVLTWSGSSDTGSGLNRYEVAIGTTSGGTNTLNWTSVGLVTSVQMNGLSLLEGTTYFSSVRAVDGAGNISVASNTSGWIPDVTPPSLVTGLNDGNTFSSIFRTPMISWTTSTDSISGLQKYEVKIGTTTGGAEVGTFNAGISTQFIGAPLNLTSGTTYYASVRATDIAGNSSAWTNSDGWYVPTCVKGKQVLSYTGANQLFNVPASVTSLKAKLWAAGGGSSQNCSASLLGGGGDSGHFLTGVLDVTGISNLTVLVGGKGSNGSCGVGGGGGGRSALLDGASELFTSGGGSGGSGSNGFSYAGRWGTGTWTFATIYSPTPSNLSKGENGSGGSYGSGAIGGFGGGSAGGTNGTCGGGGGGGGGYMVGSGATRSCQITGTQSRGGQSYYDSGKVNGVLSNSFSNSTESTTDPDYVLNIGSMENNGMIVIEWCN